MRSQTLLTFFFFFNLLTVFLINCQTISYIFEHLLLTQVIKHVFNLQNLAFCFPVSNSFKMQTEKNNYINFLKFVFWNAFSKLCHFNFCTTWHKLLIKYFLLTPCVPECAIHSVIEQICTLLTPKTICERGVLFDKT